MCACVYTNSGAFLSRDDVLAYAMQNINDNSDYDIAVANNDDDDDDYHYFATKNGFYRINSSHAWKSFRIQFAVHSLLYSSAVCTETV